MVVLALFTEYSLDNATDGHVAQYYSFLTDVYMMIFVGFGCLMTFLRRYSYSAIGFNFVASCVVILEAIVAIGVAQQGWPARGARIAIDLHLLIDAAFAAGAGMIAFGAVLGKATPTQLLWLLALQVPLYAANSQLVAEHLGVLDVGGSITIHAFGACYGLAASRWLAPKGSGAAHAKNGAAYPTTDLTAMLGTLFLFIYWPSFNGALASAPGAQAQPQAYCVLNTVVSLLGACVAAFAASAALSGQLDMVHVQNATLAGGVAIGSSANLRISPAVALTVGVVSGLMSTAGYVVASPALEQRLRLTDTCGVFNLHAFPGVLGGLASALFAVLYYPDNAHLMAHGAAQPRYQLLGLGITLAVAVGGGALSGLLVSKVDLSGAGQALAVGQLYEDAVYWKHVPAEDADAEGEEEEGKH